MFSRIISKFKNSKNYFHILAFAIPFLILNILYVVFRFYPFGDSQILVVDSYHQYYQFLIEFRGKLLEGESILYSWHLGMGSDFMSLMAYYCASPLNLISVLVPIKYLSYFFAVLISLKISFASLFFSIYLKNIYKERDYSLAIFSLLYGFCGFIAGYYWNIMWLDVFALFPLVVLGLKLAVNENKYKLYIFSFSLCLITNYYMSIFVCIFIVIFYFFYSLNIKLKFKDFIKKGFKVLGSSILSAGLGMWILLPSAMALGKVYKASSAFQGDIKIYESFIDVLSNLLAFNYPTVTEGLPNIYSGLICIFLVVAYFYSREIKLREKILSLIVLVFLILSTNINLLNYIWHGFRYTNMLPYRFTFIFSFIVIVLSYKGYKNLTRYTNKELILLSIPSMALVILFSINRELPVRIANIILFIVYLIILFLRKNNYKKVYSVILYLLIIAEIVANTFIGVSTAGKTTYSQYNDKRIEIEKMISKVDQKEGDNFYRMEVLERNTFNDPTLYQYNGMSFFSSTLDARLSKFLDSVGVPSYPLSNRYFYCYGSPITNSIFNIKYIITKNKVLNDTFTMDFIEDENNVFLYKNHKALPLGFMADENAPRVNFLNGLIKNQNEMFKSLAGIEEDVFENIENSNIEIEDIELHSSSNGIYDYEMKEGKESGNLKIEYNIQKSGYYYLETDKTLLRSISVGKEEELNEFETRENGVVSAGYYDKGDKVIVSVGIIDKDDGSYYCHLSLLNEDVFNKGYSKLSDEIINIENYNSNSIKGNITVKEKGYFFTSIPYNEGWELYIDGKKEEIIPYKDAFVGTYLEEGNHILELKYTSPGLIYGILATELSIIIIVFVYCRKKIKELSSMKLRSNYEEE
ncbi:YfhO family protein [Peptostreptococcaceae bacterium OttesenSCG-928-C18]|nr:YfhO family protein [Peptostreptococcaceae bacterium OttesenSCG-928-C18]